MATPPANLFSTPDSPGDVPVVFVLIEGSGVMLGCWNDIRNYFLPKLFDALCASHPGTSQLRIFLQVATDPYDRVNGVGYIEFTYAQSRRQLPDFPFDASVSSPLSPANVRRCLENMRAATPRDRSSTRHLIIVAMSQPFSQSAGYSQSSVFSSPENWQSIARLLYQDRVRLHMILNSSSHLNAFREFHRNALELQARPEAPLWFQVLPRYTVNLAAKTNVSDTAGESPMPVPSSAFTNNPVTPTNTLTSLPSSSSPTHESPSPSHSVSSSPPSRRPRRKSREVIVPPDSPDAGPGLVNILKQMHGLTKKRTYGGKSGKKSGVADSPRASSSRPILPRLELPATNLPTGTETRDRASEIAALEAASSGNNRYAPIAPAMSPTKTTPPVETRRAPAHRWPWLQPASLTAPNLEGLQLSETTAAALRNLQAIAPRTPELSTHLPGEQAAAPRNGAARDAEPNRSRGSISTHTQASRQATYPPYGMSLPSQPSSAVHISHPTYRHTVGPARGHHVPEEIPLPSHSASPVLRQSSTYSAQHQHSQYSPYRMPPQAGHGPHATSQSSPPLSSSLSPEQPDDESTEDQPFVITPEYEALANAEFEEAFRSGAMQASMTPTVLSPAATSPIHGPGGYFAFDPASSSPDMQPLAHQTPTITQAQPNYQYSQHDGQHGHDVLYQQTQAPGPSTTSSPSNNLGYYSPPPGPPPGEDHTGRRWYGA